MAASLTPPPAWATDKRLPRPASYLSEAYERLLIDAEGSQCHREGLRDTPKRAARAWAELTRGYHEDLELTTFEKDGYDEIVCEADVPFYSLCEHHILPFSGTIDFAYLPGERILGLSKFARLTDHYSRRLQVQERLTKQLADKLEEALAPQGVLVVVRASHLCMEMRGVSRMGAQTTTSVVRGAFKSKPEARAEALALLGGKR